MQSLLANNLDTSIEPPNPVSTTVDYVDTERDFPTASFEA
jgi:hypothetical protein